MLNASQNKSMKEIGLWSACKFDRALPGVISDSGKLLGPVYHL